MTSDEDLRKIVKESVSFADAMRKCGQKPRGASFQYFQYRLKRLGIDTSHFLGHAARAGIRNGGKCQKQHWSEILITISGCRERSGKLRRAFIEYCRDESIPYQCSICGQKTEWNGIRLEMQIDHINEINNDNVPENIRWICPNCHSQKSLKSQKIKTPRICSRCGINKRSKGSKVCAQCHGIERRKNSKCPPRDVLISILQQMPATHLAKKMGVSDTVIVKWCMWHNIDKPPRGYWQKKNNQEKLRLICSE